MLSTATAEIKLWIVKRPKLVISAVGLAVALLLAGLAAFHHPPVLLTSWIAGPSFNRMLSQAVSDALKVNGQFGPMSLQPDWSVSAENFNSEGWPGQAIGALDTGRATGSFDFWGMLRGEWRVPLIQIASAEFTLVTPDDELKSRDPVLPPKPWYAFAMPSRFSCGWIDCPDMSINLPFGRGVVRGEAMHVGAKMVGQNFKYFGKSGRLLYPEYPAMAVDAFEVYVTRKMIDIGYLYLREPASPRSNLKLALQLGQHADKSIKASAQIDHLDIVPFLPANVAKVLTGRLSGELDYATDSSGEKATGGGTVSLAGGVLSNWKYLDSLAARSGNPDFQRLSISDASVSYALEDDIIRIDKLSLRVGSAMTASGRGSWNSRTSDATLSLAVSGIPLEAYLPPHISGSLGGAMSGNLEWAWNGTDIEKGAGGGTLQLQDAKLSGFSFQKFLDRFFKRQSYAKIVLSLAECRWRQDSTGLYLENINILAPAQAGLRGSLHVSDTGALSGTILAGLPESSLHWLPDATKTVFARNEDGLHWCVINLTGTEDKPRTDFTVQVLRQLEKHPVAMAELATRGISWWLGDLLKTRGAEKEG